MIMIQKLVLAMGIGLIRLGQFLSSAYASSLGEQLLVACTLNILKCQRCQHPSIVHQLSKEWLGFNQTIRCVGIESKDRYIATNIA
jgi:hypothetical protein